ncbi:MAG TPA: VWA domain-containing protein [Candidatus Acidoferrales bacterium]|nr:VWA domain-containing protein [Candidatus Acidoferrales bacterium]
MQELLLAFVAAACACGVSGTVSRAQDTGKAAEHPLQSATELVKVETSVVDKRGDFVSGLSQSDFRVFDGGAERPIEFFAPVEAPAQVLVMIETSPAVYLIHNEHLVAAYALLDGLAADDQVALVTYDQKPRAVLDFTPDKSALLAAINQVQYTIGMGELNFYDSVSAVLDWLATTSGKRAMVILSTGLDSSPPERWDLLVQKLQGEDVVIFSVALGGTLRGDTDKQPKKGAAKRGAKQGGSAAEAEFARADSALRSLASITGGRAYFPQSGKDFAPIYHEIATALGHQYVLGIVPAHDGQYHTLGVQVLDRGSAPAATSSKKAEYRVLARAGYLAPRP